MKFEKYELKGSLVLPVLNIFIEILSWFFTPKQKFWKIKPFQNNFSLIYPSDSRIVIYKIIKYLKLSFDVTG